MKQKKILIIDKETKFILMAIDTLLYLFKLSVTCYLKEGFNKAKTESPDLIILGAVEPENDTVILFNKLMSSQETKNIPILLVECFPYNNIEYGCFIKDERNSFNQCKQLKKPVKPSILLSEVIKCVTLDMQNMAIKYFELIEEVLIKQIEDWRKMKIRLLKSIYGELDNKKYSIDKIIMQ